MEHGRLGYSIARAAVAAVLPALADEMERAFPLAADYLRFLVAAPADDQEDD
jgi:hypothetical protein